MSIVILFVLSAAICLIAFLYSSVGHAGASGYIAIMTLAELDDKFIKPTALTLNIFVAMIAAWQFARRGHFSWQLFWPFALLAIPMAFVGGYVSLPTTFFKALVGVILLYSAIRFLVRPSDDTVTNVPSPKIAIPTGAGLGLLAGLTGTGGGIFLTPLILTMKWATTKTAASVSAVFILFVSISGLLGTISSTKSFPFYSIPLVIAAVVGGSLGSYLGSGRFQPTTLKRILAIVLTIAGTKLVWTAIS
jgi:uncharacterized protein